ncbi:hypothetical protein D0T84_14090 [Dysgonomonas sp. 521]|uniref:VapE domain-containing protein n=1 Tax=Dysgonomonas sp. 521 TaxID=2302932 RepID=UPI0013D2C89F|nr:VapE domain-containing protein [Dysgonomonas sp. 521]NDV96034.1 hypothetical protein [Dysgonomonas sp. 521]
MGQIQPIDVKGTTPDMFRDEIKQIVGFLQEHYEIRIPAQDPSKIKITCKDESRYSFPPDFGDIWLHLKSEGHSVSKDILRTVIRSPNYITPCDPIREYFDSVRKKWQGESQIDKFCNYIIPRVFEENTPEYYRERTNKLIKKWFVACVACWIGKYPNDVALGFIHSSEGIGKTHLVEFFVPDMLKEYYVKSSKDDKKFDIEDVFTRYMIVNFDELNGVNPRSVDTFKSCMSDRKILNKRRHEEFATDKDRIGCAVFTTNRNQELGGFLHDSYGYRRWGIIELEDIDREYSKVVDVDQLWSEALTLFEETEFNYKFEQPDYDDFKEYNRRYMFETSAMKFVQLHLTVPQSNDEGEKLNASAIFARLRNKIRKEDQSKITITKLGTALTALGFPKISFRDDDGNSIKGYRVIFNDDKDLTKK